jgi:hypothetical protein
MLNSETLEIAIGMVFLFLLMALICTAIKEWIEGVLKWRAMDLERGLRTMLNDPGGSITKHLFDHPQIYSLFAGNYDPKKIKKSSLTPGRPGHMSLFSRRNLPSYIPAASFSAAFIDLVGKGPPPAQGKPTGDASVLTVAALSARAAQLHSPYIRRVMLSAIDYGGGDLEKVRKNIEQWFDATMDRTAGWYKRRTQAVLFVIGLAAAVGLNVDSMNVLHRLTSDKTFRDAVVKEAAAAKAPKPDGKNTDPVTELQALHEQIDNVELPVGWKESRREIQLPWGWGSVPIPVPAQLCMPAQSVGDRVCYPNPTASVFRMVIGWLITALAVMLGAPFWFDVLNRIMVIRSTVKPHEKSPEEASQDKQDRGGTKDKSDAASVPPPPKDGPPANAAPIAAPTSSWTDFTKDA